VIYDAAHNPDGFKRLLEALEHHFPGRPFRMFLGFSQDKEIEACLNLCSNKARHIYLTQTNSSRSASPHALAQFLEAIGYRNHSTGVTLKQALADSEDLLVVAGSFYLKEMQDVVR
jgi:dihydrofolate synthase/folylpolyglutamate synthase